VSQLGVGTGSLRVSLKYNFFPLPGQEGGQGNGRPDSSGFSTLLKTSSPTWMEEA